MQARLLESRFEIGHAVIYEYMGRCPMRMVSPPWGLGSCPRGVHISREPQGGVTINMGHRPMGMCGCTHLECARRTCGATLWHYSFTTLVVAPAIPRTRSTYKPGACCSSETAPRRASSQRPMRTEYNNLPCASSTSHQASWGSF
jgi:hypothetical protein